MSSLIGGIVERPRSNASPSAPSPSSSTSGQGFPVAKHRSQSAFARARQTQQKTGMGGRPSAAPVVIPSAPRAAPITPPSDAGHNGRVMEDWRAQIDQQNTTAIENMTAEQRQQAISEIFDTLGDGVGDLLQRARAARERKRAEDGQPAQNPLLSVATEAEPLPKALSTPVETPLSSRPATPSRSALRSSVSRPTPRKVSFQELQPQDVHVYESQPPSPRRVLGLLAPPSEEDAGIPVQKLSYVPMAPHPAQVDEPMDVDSASPDAGPVASEDEPAAIRARFFPNESLDNPSLEWMKQPEGGADDARARFDLKGQAIPAELVDTLPSHLGLHHHAQGSRAGYTLEDVLLLSHSTVPAQRATMLGVLASIVRQLRAGTLDELNLGIDGGRDAVRGRILDAAIDALGEPGSLGVRAVDVVWEGIVQWDQALLSIPDVWLDIPAGDSSTSSTLSSLPLPQLLAHMKAQFAHAALPAETLEQLLAVLYRLVRHSLETCKAVLSVDGLLQTVSRLFLPTRHGQGISSYDGLPAQPNPLAITLFRALAASSREHALSLIEVADSLLRYVVTFNAQGTPLELALVAETLRFYECLARYGLYSNVVSIASEHFSNLQQALKADLSAPQVEVLRAFLRLTEAWTVCATDPHKTTPEHDLLWSQVAGWDWGGELLALRETLAATDGTPALHADLWAATAAWLDGCKMNSLRAGSDEKDRAITAFLEGFRSGRERAILEQAVHGLSDAVTATDNLQPRLELIHQHASVLHQAVRLAVATARPGAPGSLASALSADAALTSLLATVPAYLVRLQDGLARLPRLYTLLRPLTSLVYSLHALISVSSTFNALNLVATSASIIRVLLPGDEDLAASILRSTLRLIGPELFTSLDMPLPASWKDDALLDLEPFLLYSLRRKGSPYHPPWTPSPDSIKNADSQTLPPTLGVASLPPSNDWPFWPLNELLQSGTSPVFHHLPPGWDATETDVVRASLLFVQIIQRSLARSSLSEVAELRLSREEAVFGCMRVFMLEHGQDSSASSQEVFRDDVVEARMRDLLRPITVAGRGQNSPPSGNIEEVAARYLGSGTPFFQFYTDFVTLYDAISFSHPLFATLLIPPLAMRYAHDYRNLLFSEFRVTLKNISVHVPNLLADDPMEFMQPIERNPEVLGAMLGALLKGEVRDFLHAMCVHHVACTIWPDLHPEGTDSSRLRLLHIVMAQGSVDLIRAVVLYGGCQSSGPTVAQAETCRSRLEWLRSHGDDNIGDRLQGLLLGHSAL